MALRLGSVVLGVDDMERATAFWSAALGYEIVRFEGSANEFTILRPPSGEGTRIGLQIADTPPQPAPRVHLDLIVSSAQEQDAEVERLVALGARRVDWPSYPEDPDFVVVEDPEGNRFCVVDESHG